MKKLERTINSMDPRREQGPEFIGFCGANEFFEVFPLGSVPGALTGKGGEE